MKIAIIAPPESEWQSLADMLRACAGSGGEVGVIRYGLDDPLYTPPDSDTSAVFAFVDNMKSLTAARKIALWDTDMPLVFVCKDPGYALEGIRLNVRDYLLQPLRASDVNEAVNRVLAKRRRPA